MQQPEYLFISDLHLSADSPQTVALFLHFLAGRARRAQRLYILGDLFDAWIGDDDHSALHARVIDGLRGLSDSGVTVFLQHGNRDFLIGKRFVRASGCQLLKDPWRIDLFGTPSLLMHGDLLCSDDLPYQRFRRKVRNPLVQWWFLHRDLTWRRAQAANYRRGSGAAKSEKSADIMDVNQETVRKYMLKYRVSLLIHGHTHRPARHRLQLNDTEAQRWVLAEWHDDRGSALRMTAQGLETLELTADPNGS